MYIYIYNDRTIHIYIHIYWYVYICLHRRKICMHACLDLAVHPSKHSPSDVVCVGFDSEKITFLKKIERYLVVLFIFSQYLVTHGPPDTHPIM